MKIESYKMREKNRFRFDLWLRPLREVEMRNYMWTCTAITMTSKAMIDAAASALHVTESSATARHPFPISIRQFSLLFPFCYEIFFFFVSPDRLFNFLPPSCVFPPNPPSQNQKRCCSKRARAEFSHLLGYMTSIPFFHPAAFTPLFPPANLAARWICLSNRKSVHFPLNSRSSPSKSVVIRRIGLRSLF